MIETVISYAIAALLMTAGLATVYLIDKPREPITRATAILSLILNALIAYWIIRITR